MPDGGCPSSKTGAEKENGTLGGRQANEVAFCGACVGGSLHRQGGNFFLLPQIVEVPYAVTPTCRLNGSIATHAAALQTRQAAPVGVYDALDVIGRGPPHGPRQNLDTS